MIRRTTEIIYGCYVWLAFLILALLVLPGAILLPGIKARRWWAGVIGRLIFKLAFIPVTISGKENIPTNGCVIVGNHASYIDGILMQAFMPNRFAYAIKGEMQKVPLAGLLLRRLGSHFINRQSEQSRSRDARNLVRAGAQGDSLGVFPEGTFIAEPGLAKFHSGAFVVAIRNQLPVVPVIIKGSRYVLPADRWLPRRGPVSIEVLQPISPPAIKTESARSFAHSVRQHMLQHLDEPDLLNSTNAAEQSVD